MRAQENRMTSAGGEASELEGETYPENADLGGVNRELRSRIEELEKRNGDLQNLISAAAVATVILDCDLRIMHFTAPAAELLGLRPGDTGRPLSEIRHPLDYPELAADANRALTTPGPTEREVRAGERYFAARTAAYRSGEDRIGGVVLTFVDVTQRKEIEGVLRRNEERLRLATDAADMGIWSWNVTEDRVIWENDWPYGFFGVAREEGAITAARFTAEFLHPDDVPGFAAAVGAATERGERFDFLGRVRRTDGEERWLEISGRPAVGLDGKINILGIARDATKRENAANALEESEERFRAVANSMTQLAWIARPDGHLFWYNQRWYDYTGATPEQMEGWGWQTVHDPEELPKVLEQWKRSISTGEPFEMTFPMRGADGGFRQFLTRAFPLKDAENRVMQWFGTNTDVDELSRTEKALNAARIAAETANKVKDRFLAVLSHELRTPLTPVLMTAAALEHDPWLRADVREEMTMIKRNIELETKLIDDLLDLSRIASGKIELKIENIDLNEAVMHTCTICRPQLLERKQRLELELGNDIGAIPADPARLQQILWNVLKNAVKFTAPEGRIVLSTARLDAERCEVRVRDSGIGIERELVPLIFNAFEQGDVQITRKFGGLGLGLAISKALVELHGGTIRAESEGVNQGATFVIELPRSKAAPASPGRIGDAGGAIEKGAIRLLLVEDHPDTARTLARLLRKGGYTVTEAADVASALAAVEREEFDLVVSDLGLPDGDGYDLMRAVGERRSVPGIAMSGYGMEEDIKRSREAGFSEHLVKPISYRDLVWAIRRVTEGRG
jgi:PAS domain S-box-containing protein